MYSRIREFFVESLDFEYKLTHRHTFVGWRWPATLIPHDLYENDETRRTSARLRFIRLISAVNPRARSMSRGSGYFAFPDLEFVGCDGRESDETEWENIT